MKIGNLTLLNVIGSGEYGEVFLSTIKGDNKKYATKKMEKAKIEKPASLKYFVNEITILREINHPNCIKIKDLKENATDYFLVTELCNGGTLSKCLEKHRCITKKPAFSQEVVQYLMRQIVSAVNYLHANEIIHRDLKLDNIIVNFPSAKDAEKMDMLKCQVKIIDFGFARHLNSDGIAGSVLGSPINMDPMILNRLYQKISGIPNDMPMTYDTKVDIWSLGTLCYELLIGKATFDAKSMEQLLLRVEKGNYYLPTELSKEAVSFLNCMLQYDSNNRASAAELKKHPFLTKSIDKMTPLDVEAIQRKNANGYLKMNVKRIRQSVLEMFDTEDEIEEKNVIIEKNIPKTEKMPKIEEKNEKIEKNEKKKKRATVLNQTNQTERYAAVSSEDFNKIQKIKLENRGLMTRKSPRIKTKVKTEFPRATFVKARKVPVSNVRNNGENFREYSNQTFDYQNKNPGFNEIGLNAINNNNNNNLKKTKENQKEEITKREKNLTNKDILFFLNEMNKDFILDEPILIPFLPGTKFIDINGDIEYNQE